MISQFEFNFQFQNFKKTFLSEPLSKEELWQSSLPCTSTLTLFQDNKAMQHPLHSASELGEFGEVDAWGSTVEAEYEQCRGKGKYNKQIALQGLLPYCQIGKAKVKRITMNFKTSSEHKVFSLSCLKVVLQITRGTQVLLSQRWMSPSFSDLQTG